MIITRKSRKTSKRSSSTLSWKIWLPRTKTSKRWWPMSQSFVDRRAALSSKSSTLSMRCFPMRRDSSRQVTWSISTIKNWPNLPLCKRTRQRETGLKSSLLNSLAKRYRRFALCRTKRHSRQKFYPRSTLSRPSNRLRRIPINLATWCRREQKKSSSQAREVTVSLPGWWRLTRMIRMHSRLISLNRPTMLRGLSGLSNPGQSLECRSKARITQNRSAQNSWLKD